MKNDRDTAKEKGNCDEKGKEKGNCDEKGKAKGNGKGKAVGKGKEGNDGVACKRPRFNPHALHGEAHFEGVVTYFEHRKCHQSVCVCAPFGDDPDDGGGEGIIKVVTPSGAEDFYFSSARSFRTGQYVQFHKVPSKRDGKKARAVDVKPL